MKKFYHNLLLSSICFVLFFGLSFETAVAGVMSSGSYSIQADSMNFGGVRSSSASYALEDTGGEVGTGDLEGTSNKLHAGYQQASVVATAATTTTTSTPTTGQTSSSGRLPINVIHFTATAGNTSIFLGWQYPDYADIQSVRIVRSTTFFPLDITDGEVIFEGDALEVIDHNVVPGVLYYYTIFAQNSRGLYSSGVIASARIIPRGGIVVAPTSTDPFANIPDASNVHPAISALTLLDFDFIQDGQKITHAGTTVVIDGKKNLTVQLAYDKVPQLLKTIAISLADPDDETKIFTFLLRVNADQTAYEATIAPLTKSGSYKLHAIVLDYQNQGLKRLEGDLRAVVFEGVAGLIERGGIPMNWIWILIVLVSICCIMLLLRSIRRNKNRGMSGGQDPTHSVPRSTTIKSPTSLAVYKKILTLLIIGMTVLASSGISVSIAQAAINKQINYQGKLADSSDTAVADGTYAMHFKLYTASSGGSAIWTEDRTGANEVQVTDGLFSVMLGSVTALTSVDFNQTLYLGVTIESDSEMTPRKIIGAVPSAFVADTLDGLDSTQFLRADTGSATIGYFVATSTTASVFPYASTTMVTATTASTTNLVISGLGGSSIRCLQVGVDGTVAANAAACGSSGFGGGSWSTTTSQVAGQVVNYSNNTTDVVVIGGTATTSAEFFFDPNINYTKLSNGAFVIDGTNIYTSSGVNFGIGTTSPNWKLSVAGTGSFDNFVRASYFTATSTTASTFPYASTTALTVSGSTYLTGLSAGGVAVNSAGLLYNYATSTWTFASSTLLGDSNTFTGNQTFNGSNVFGGASTFNSTLTVGSLNGPLQANNGLVSATTSIGVLYGGTGWSAIQASAIPYGNGTGALATTTAGTAGYVLAYLNGIPTWTATTTFGTGLTYSAGNVTVNTSQNIATLSNLTSNGFVKTSGGTGALSIDTNTYLTSALTSIGPTGQTTTGPAVTLATSSTAFNGLTASTTITGSGTELTFANTLAGLLTAGGGGTGIASPEAAKVLLGNYAGTGWQQLATSSLGIAFSSLTGTLGVSQGGTGATSFGQGWLYSNGGTGAIAASTSPTINYFTATSTTAISTILGGLSVGGPFRGLVSPYTRVEFSDPTGGYESDWAFDIVGGGFGTIDFGSSGGTYSSRTVNTFTASEVGTLSYQGTGLIKGLTWDGSVFRNSSAIEFQIDGTQGSSDTPGAISFYTTPDGSATLQNRMIIRNSGNIGIGTTSPYAKLSVNGRGVFNQDVRADYFTATSTSVASTFPYASTTALTVSGNTYLTSLSSSGLGVDANGKVYAAATTTFSSGLTYASGNVTNTGVTSIAQTYGTGQIGAITLATSSATSNGITSGLNITNSSGDFTLTPTLSGTLTVGGGGTGLSSSPSYGQLLLGNASSGYTLSATSSLGLLGSSTVSSLTTSYIPKWGGSSFSNSLVYDNGTQVAVGTTTTWAPLSIAGNVEIRANSLTLATSTHLANMSGAGFSVINGRYAYITSQAGTTGSLAVYDISSSTNPLLLKQITNTTTVGGAEEVKIVGQYLYIALLGGNGFSVFDISSPANPVNVGLIQDATNLYGADSFEIVGNYAYVSDYSSTGGSQPGLTVLNISDPKNPTIAATLTSANFDKPVFVRARYPYLYITNQSSSKPYLNVIDISKPTSPVLVATLQPTGATDYINAFDIYGKYMYIMGYGNNKIFVVDISTPTAPVSVASVASFGSPFNIKVAGNNFFMTHYTSHAISQYSLSSSTNPTLVTTLTDSSQLYNPDDIQLINDHLYVSIHGNGSTILGGLAIINVPALTVPFVNFGAGIIETLNVTRDLFADRLVANTSLQANTIWSQNQSSASNFYAASSTLNNTFAGNVGIGTTSPYAKLSVNGRGVFNQDVRADYFTATSTTATSTFAAGIQATYLNLTGSTASSTASNGINISAGCFAINGTCVGGSGGGAVTSVSNVDGTLTISPTTGAVVGSLNLANANTWTALQQFSNASSSLLSVYGPAYFGATATSSFSSTGVLTLVSALAVSSGGTGWSAIQSGYIPFGNGSGALSTSTRLYWDNTNSYLGLGTTSPYAALSVVGATGVVADKYYATSTTATSTFAGGLDVGAGSLLYDLSTGITSASTFQTGNLNFDTDAGMVSWADLPLSSAANGTIQGYTASLNGSSTIAVYGISAGSGWLQNDYPRVAIGSTTPPSSKLTVFGNGTGTGGTFEVANSASTTLFKIFDNGKSGLGTTSPFATFAINPIAGAASNQFVVGSSTATNFIINNSGAVGIASSTPWRTLSVVGTAAINGLTSSAGGEYAVCINDTTKELTNAGAQSCLVSSKRFKDNIEPLSDSLNTILSLKPSSFTLKNQSPTDTHIGFIAEDVDQVDKRLVQYEPDGVTPRTVRYEEVTALLAKAIQEQQGQIGVLASTTIDLNSKDSEFALFLATNLASSSQTTRTLASALDMTNIAVTDIAARFDILSATTSEMAIRLTGLENQFSQLTSNTAFMAAVASSTATLLASSTADILASSTPSFIVRIATAVKEMISSTGEWVIAKVSGTLAVFNRVETQTASIKNGLEMTDQATGQIYCVTIKNGDFVRTLGSCGEVTATSSPEMISTPATVVPVSVPVATPVITPATTVPVSLDSNVVPTETTPIVATSTPVTEEPVSVPVPEASSSVTSSSESTPTSVPVEATALVAPEPASVPAPEPEPALANPVTPPEPEAPPAPQS